MMINLFAAEQLMKLRQQEIENQARHAWKWNKKQTSRKDIFFNKLQIKKSVPNCC